MAEDLDPALVEGQEAAHEPDERGLAASVCSEKAVDVAPFQLDRDVLDGHDGRFAAVHLEPLRGVFHK